MKIISKYKDYYDYLQGIYGVDDKLVLDRTINSPIPSKPGFLTKEVLHVGEYMVEGLWVDGKIHFGEEIEKFSETTRPYYFNFKKDIYYILNGRRYIEVLKKPKYLGNNSPTWKKDCPILRLIGNDSYDFNPILRQYDMQKVYSPHEIWLILSEWLGKRIDRKSATVPVGSDRDRILSAGFDLKTSFRNIK